MGFRLLALAAAFCMLAPQTFAQSKGELTSKMQDALKQDDTVTAITSAEALYQLNLAQGDLNGAGGAAFSKAKIFDYVHQYGDAAKAYSLCEKHYRSVNALAQTLHCKYSSGLAYSLAGKSGAGLDALKSTAKELEQIGQSKSSLAVNVYLSLAKEILPSKLDRLKGATRERKSSIEYAGKAMAALEAAGQGETELYASALLLKAKAFEDLEQFEDAVSHYAQAIALYEELPDSSDEVIKNAKSRLSIARAGTKNLKQDNTVTVLDVAGNETVLTIKRKRKVKFPKLNKNQLVDGARVTAKVTLNSEAGVETIEIVESTPTPEFGEAFIKAAKGWTFTPPDGVSPEEIPAFEYSMVFFVQRL